MNPFNKETLLILIEQAKRNIEWCNTPSHNNWIERIKREGLERAKVDLETLKGFLNA